MSHKIGNGAILGIASEDGVASQKRIVLMDRSTLSVVSKTIADSNGAYSFGGLNVDSDDYIVFAVDDDGNPKKQAIIYDYVQPIPAHQGGFFWGNWFYSAMIKEPMVMFTANTDGETSLDKQLPFGAGKGAAIVYAANVVTDKTSITPAAPSLPAVDITSGYIAKKALPQKNFLSLGGNTEITCEWVLDTSKTTDETWLSLNTMAAYDFSPAAAYPYYQQNIMAVSYQPSGHTITMSRWDGRLSGGSDRWWQYLSNTPSYTLPVEQQGTVLHITAVVKYNISATLYINGVQVATHSLAGMPSKIGFNASGNQVEISALISSPRSDGSGLPSTQKTTFSTSVFCFYSKALSASDIQDNYDALFVGGLPLITGYLKSVVESQPLYFFRLHDFDESEVSVDSLRPNAIDTMSYLQKALPPQISRDITAPYVRSGASTTFSGGALISKNYFGAPVSNEFISVEFVAKPADTVFTGWQSILAHTTTSFTSFFEVRRYADERWCLQWRENNTEKLVYFETTADKSSFHHYVFTVDKVEGEAKLYVDGLLVETVVVTNVKFTSLPEASRISSFMMIAGRSNLDLSLVTNPYLGSLAEVAMYPNALSARLVGEHYAAISII